MISQDILNTIARHSFATDLPGTSAYNTLMEARNKALTFNTKDEYLQWVKDWKAQYVQLSKDSRAAKFARKRSQPTYNPVATTLVWQYKQQAHVLLDLRKDAKRMSWERKQALKAA